MAERITTVIQGTPVEAGGQVFTELVMPVLKACGNRPPREIQQFYAGLLSATIGSMCADFGHAQAMTILRAMVESVGQMGDDLPGGLKQ